MANSLRIFLAAATAVTLPFVSSAQLTVEQGFTIEEYVNDILLGNGVTATNITYSGGFDQLGYMTEGDGAFSISSGLVMSTDNAVNIGCPTDFPFCSDCGGMGVDNDLLDIANSVPGLIGESFTVQDVNDLAVLEFDFVAAGDTVRFNYVFGSDEYEVYVNTQYNDVFAFFLSGPGITGPYDSPAGFPGGAVNIAGVPESDPNLPVTISSVNSQTNSTYYIDNQDNDGACVNGYTQPFVAEYPVECGETYHIKLAIADGTDTALESIVVLEEGSFESNAVVQIDLSIDVGGPDSETIYEDCGTATLTFERPVETILEIQEMVYINYDGSDAINGVDYGIPDGSGGLDPLPDSIVFEPFVSIVEFQLTAAIDGIPEGPEQVIMQIENVAACNGGGLTTYFEFTIAENPPPFVVDDFYIEICNGITVDASPVVSGGYGNYTFDWQGCIPEDYAPVPLTPDADFICDVIVGDTCGIESQVAQVQIDVLDLPPLEVEISPDEILLECNGSVFINATATGGDGFYTYDWYSNNGNLFPLWSGGVDLGVWNNADTVFVEVEDGCGFIATDWVEVDENIPPIEIQVASPFEVLCNNDFALPTNVTGSGPFTYSWFGPNGAWLDFDATLNWNVTSDQTVTLSINDACGQNETVDVEIVVEAPPVEFTIPDNLVGPCTEDFAINPAVTSGSGNYNYTWYQDGALLASSNANLVVNSDVNTTISLNVTDGCGQSNSGTTEITIDNPPLEIELGDDIFASCVDNTDIPVQVISGAGDYEYAWTVAGIPAGSNASQVVQSFVTIPVSVQVMDGCGGVAEDDLVYHIPDIPLNITITPDSTICAGDQISLVAEATGGEDGFVYHWPSLDAYGNVQSIAPTQNANYPVVATDICGKVIEADVFVEVQYLFSQFTVSPLEPENAFLFNATPSPEEPFEGAYTYEWDFGDGNGSDLPSVEHTFNGLSEHTVSLGVTSWVGCTDTAYTVVNGPVLIYIPTAFTPNNDGKNDAFRVVGDQIEQFEITVFDRWGAQVFHSEDVNEVWVGDINGGSHFAPNGIYHYVLRVKGYDTEAQNMKGYIQLVR
jgi:gliding motility-associated-like protein